MFFRKYIKTKRKAGTYAKKKRAVAGRKGSSVGAAVKKYVNKIIHKNIENKNIQVSQSQSFGTVLESPDLNAFPMCPQTGYWALPQGVGQGARIGNVVRIRKIMLNYVLRPNPYDVTFNPNPLPVNVIMMLGYIKNQPSTVPTSTDISQLFQSGSSVQAPYGNLKDLLMPINRDFWVIKKKWIHKIGFASDTGTGGNVGYEYHANNDFKYNAIKRLNITNLCPSTNVFNDSASGTSTRNLYLMYEAVSASGNTIASPYTPVTIDYWIDYTYEDA